MDHLFYVYCKGTTKLVTVNGTKDYAIQYIAGYVQALRDRFGKLTTIRVKHNHISGETVTKLFDVSKN